MNTEARIKKLHAVKLANAIARKEYNPAVSAQFAVEGILAMYRTQMDHIDALLDEEIEDAEKAGRQFAAGQGY